MAYDIVHTGAKYASEYTRQDMEEFEGYIAQQLILAESTLDRQELRNELLHIYSNPVESKENL